jgi:CubicO group peptidase (beta-lactamase class C family)
VEAFRPLYSERYAKYPNACYSRQWWVYDRDSGLHCAQGVFGQMIYVRPKDRVVAVKLSSWPDFLNDNLRASTLAALEAITREVAG